MTKRKNQKLTYSLLFIWLILSIMLVLVAVKRNHLRHTPLPSTLMHPPTFTEIVSNNPSSSNLLAPYIAYNQLINHLNNLPTTEVDNFLLSYKDTPLANKLRYQWLNLLIIKQQWVLFLKYYEASNDAGMQCNYATALLNTGQTKAAYQLAVTLWMIPKIQSSNCNALFAHWIAAQQLTLPMLWKRYHMAIAADRPALMSSLIPLFPLDQQPLAKIWLEVRGDPKIILNKQLFKPEDNSQTDVLVYGITRLALQDTTMAVNAWNILKTEHTFSYAQVQQVIQAIAISYIKGDHQQAKVWLQQIDPAYLNATIINWRLLFAIEEQNWVLLKEWIKQLPETTQTEPQWQYWYARALEATQQPEEAKRIFASLATQMDYYGFLSALRLNQPITIKNQAKPISQGEIEAFLTNPGIQRMRVLFAINQTDYANLEWWYALQRMDQKQRYVAITMLTKWKMYNLAISSTPLLSDRKDLSLSYPQPYSEIVKENAEAFNIDPAFIYAIIRQESMFNPQANSYAGAQGLMQLMRPTAAMLIRQDKLPVYFVEQLNLPEVNIQLGTIYLSRLLTMYQQNPAWVAAAYNAGPYKVKHWLPPEHPAELDSWVDSIPYNETRTYVKHVLTYMFIYQNLLGQPTSLQISTTE